MITIATLTAAASAVGPLIKALKPLVSKIQHKSRENEQVRKNLETKLAKIDSSLKKVSILGEVAETYTETLVSLLQLQRQCNRAIEWIDYHKELFDLRLTNYEQSWAYLRQLKSKIKENMDVPRKDSLGRIVWYKDQDKAQIPNQIDELQRYYERCMKELENITPDAVSLRTDLSEMDRRLDSIITAIEDTLYKKIINGFKKLG